MLEGILIFTTGRWTSIDERKKRKRKSYEIANELYCLGHVPLSAYVPRKVTDSFFPSSSSCSLSFSPLRIFADPTEGKGSIETISRVSLCLSFSEVRSRITRSIFAISRVLHEIYAQIFFSVNIILLAILRYFLFFTLLVFRTRRKQFFPLHIFPLRKSTSLIFYQRSIITILYVTNTTAPF